MKFILSMLFSMIILSANAQSYRKTNFTAPLKGTASFTDPKFTDYDPILTNLDQSPIPYAEYGMKKELLNKKRRETDLSLFAGKPEIGVAENPTLIQEWQGNTGSGTPFDNDVAVSNAGIIISAVNANIRVYDTSGVLDFIQNINAMDSVTGLFNWISDPRLLYDPKQDRFILVCFSGNISTTSNIIVGFSTTNNPADDWHFYTLSGEPFDDNTWSDYPIIAITDKDLFMTWNHIKDNVGWQNGFAESVIYQIKKEEGYKGETLEFSIWDDLSLNGLNYRNICPVRYQETEMGDDMYFLSIRNVDFENDSLFLFHITDSYESGKATMTQQVLKSPVKYGFPPNLPMKNGNYLMTNDGRILSAMYENNRIHFGANSIHPEYNNAGVLLGEITDVCSDNPKVEASVIAKPNQEFGYPSMTWVGTGKQNKVLYTFGHCYTDSFPGFSMLYKNYQGYSDIISIKDGTTSINYLVDSNERWGDYSGVQKMYNNPSYAVMVGCASEFSSLRTKIATVINNDASIDESVMATTISDLYPNPTADRFTIKFEMPSTEQVRFSLYDLNGRLVNVMIARECRQGHNEFSFSTATLPRGNYIFVIENEKERFEKKMLSVR